MSEKKPEFESVLGRDLAGYKICKGFEVFIVRNEHVKNPTAEFQHLLGCLLNERVAKAYVEALGTVKGTAALSIREILVLHSDAQSFELSTRQSIKVISDEAAMEAIRAKVKSGMSLELQEVIFGVPKK